MFDINVKSLIDKIKIGTEHQNSPTANVKGDNPAPIVQTVGNNNSITVSVIPQEDKSKILEMFNMAKEDLEYNRPGIRSFRFEEIVKLLAYKGKFSLAAEEIALFRDYVHAAGKCNDGNIGSGSNKPGWIYGQKDSLMEILNKHIFKIENDK